ncbi:MAG: acyl-CoA thioesterase [Ginsengibacter sp.]
MSRLKIDLPERRLASFTIPVRITDVNYGNHVGNNAMIEIIHEARFRFLQKYGFTELNAGGVALIMSSISVEFKNECFYSDLLEVELYAGEISRVEFELFYKIHTERNGKIVLIALSKTTMVGFDYAVKKVKSLSTTLKNILAE